MMNQEGMNAKTPRRRGKEEEEMELDDEMGFDEPDVETDELARKIIGAAIEVHRKLGAGLDELLYENALCIEFGLRGLSFVRQPVVQVEYKGHVIGEKRLDLIVEGKIVVELKAVEQLTSLHKAQVRTYLKITGLRIGC
jgi:GxxExxY protein